MNDKVICFTGHRTIDPQDQKKLFFFLDKLLHNYIRAGYTTFRVGGALGFDMEVAEMLLRFRQEEGLRLRLELVLPCRDQASRWRVQDRRRYERILREADSIECLYDTYVDGCMQQRNRVMVDGSSICIAYCRRKRSGTFGTMRYAEQKGVGVTDLAAVIDHLPDMIMDPKGDRCPT